MAQNEEASVQKDWLGPGPVETWGNKVKKKLSWDGIAFWKGFARAPADATDTLRMERKSCHSEDSVHTSSPPVVLALPHVRK